MPYVRTDGACAPTTIIAQADCTSAVAASTITHFPLLKIDRPSTGGTS